MIGTQKRWGNLPCRCYKPFAVTSATLPAVGANCLRVFFPLSLILSQPKAVTSPLFTRLLCRAEEAELLQPLICVIFLGYQFQQLPRGSDKKGRMPDKSCCMSPVGEMSMLKVVV